MKTFSRVLLGALLALAAGTASWATVTGGAERDGTAEPVLVVSSPTDTSRQLLAVPPQADTGPATDVVVHPGDVRQSWWGTGAALTDSSVQLLRHRPGVVRALFDPDAPNGARLSMVRLPLSATDFSHRPWTWSRHAGASRPPRIEKNAVSFLRSDVLPLRPRLRVVGTPWSAPAAMKTSGSVRGGALDDAHLTAYGNLLVGQARWLARHHVRLWAATLGNEPGYSSDYASMTMTDEQMAALADRVGPRLDRLHTRLWALDHNWSDRSRVDDLLARTSQFDAAAFHCYGGQPSQMAGLAVPRIVTECTGSTDGAQGTFAWDARNLVADAVAAGSSGLMMWNLALDPAHGPVDPGSLWGCQACRGVVTVTPTGMVREPEFYTLAHLSRAADPGAHVVGTDAPSWLSVAAFRNPDGTVGVFGHNGSGTTQTVRFTVGSSVRSYVIGPGEMFSYRAPL